MSFALTLSHVGVFVTDMPRMVDFYTIDTPWYVPQPCRIPVDLSLADDELWASIEKQARALPGFKTREAWVADIEKRIAEATQKRRRAAAPVAA